MKIPVRQWQKEPGSKSNAFVVYYSQEILPLHDESSILHQEAFVMMLGS